MSIAVGVLVAIGVFAALVFGVPVIFASSGGGVILSAVIAYAAALAVIRRIAKRRDRLASAVLLVVVIGTAYTYMIIQDRRLSPPFPGASRSGINQPRKP